MHQTTFANNETVTRAWHITSAKGEVLGDVAVRVVKYLMGKHKADWTAHTDGGDFVVVTDVESLVWTRNKGEKKIYKFHSGYMGGLTEISLATLHAKKPEQVLELAVKRMLPKSQQGREQLKRLKVYKGSAHPHVAQAPKPL